MIQTQPNGENLILSLIWDRLTPIRAAIPPPRKIWLHQSVDINGKLSSRTIFEKTRKN